MNSEIHSVEKITLLDGPTEFQRAAVIDGLRAMLRGSYFNICTIDSAAKVLGVHIDKADRAALQCLHCVDWASMSPNVAEALREKCVSVLQLDSVVTVRRQRGEIDITPKRSAGGFGSKVLSLIGLERG